MKRQHTQSPSLTTRIMRVAGVCCCVLVASYLYLTFATTSMVAQHRSLDQQLEELVATRSALEYDYHASSESLFAQITETAGLASAHNITYLSLDTSVSVAFAQEAQ